MTMVIHAERCRGQKIHLGREQECGDTAGYEAPAAHGGMHSPYHSPEHLLLVGSVAQSGSLEGCSRVQAVTGATARIKTSLSYFRPQWTLLDNYDAISWYGAVGSHAIKAQLVASGLDSGNIENWLMRASLVYVGMDVSLLRDNIVGVPRFLGDLAGIKKQIHGRLSLSN